MPEQKCSTCKHFESAPMKGRGWCRNPLLYAPQQSQLVDQETLGCRTRTGSFWESSAEDAPSVAELAPRRSNGPAEDVRVYRPVANPGIVGTAPRSEVSRDDLDSPRLQPEHQRPDMDPATETPPNGGRSNGPQRQERTVSYQPEERYWTDYLRVALPVVGLLLLLGLFWYWASQVIGDDSGSPRPTPIPSVVITAVVAAPTTTQQAVITPANLTPTSPAVEPTQATDQQNPTEAAPSDATEPSGTSGGFNVGDNVITNDSVNMRADASQTSEPVILLPANTELEVIGAGQVNGQYTWIQVRDPVTGKEGWVADQFVDAAS